MRKPPPILGIALTVFIDILGFGLVIPDIQLRGAMYAHGAVLGLALGSYSIAQLIVAPLLGRYSDVVGRRKILLITTTLSTCAYIFYAHATALWIIFAARILGGMGGANLGVAYAYIADVTEPENRTKAMGVLGAAFGVGFIVGPFAGGLLIHFGSLAILGYSSAAISACNFLYVYFFLQESRPVGSIAGTERAPSFRNVALALRTPGLGLLIAMFFATNFGFSNMETTFFRLGASNFGFDKLHSTYILGEIGIVMAIMQGGVVRKVLPIFGEVKLLRLAYLLQVPCLALLPWARPWIPLLLVAMFLGVGGGLAQPSMTGLISMLSPAELQGGIFGVSQGLGAVARALGPIMGNFLFDFGRGAPKASLVGGNTVFHWMPYAFGAIIIFLPLLGSLGLKMPESRQEPTPAMAG